MATCPRCRTDLATRAATPPGRSEAIDVDCCGTCGGVWIDGAELSHASAHLAALFGKRSEHVLTAVPTGLRCPRCAASLAEVGVKDIAIDWCGTCHGVWLDGGEYQSISAPRRPVQPSTVACVGCRREVPVAGTYFTDRGLSCAECADVELAKMDANAEVTRAELARAEDQRLAYERGMASDRLQQLESDVRHASYTEVAALRRALL